MPMTLYSKVTELNKYAVYAFSFFRTTFAASLSQTDVCSLSLCVFLSFMMLILPVNLLKRCFPQNASRCSINVWPLDCQSCASALCGGNQALGCCYTTERPHGTTSTTCSQLNISIFPLAPSFCLFFNNVTSSVLTVTSSIFPSPLCIP